MERRPFELTDEETFKHLEEKHGYSREDTEYYAKERGGLKRTHLWEHQPHTLRSFGNIVEHTHPVSS